MEFTLRMIESQHAALQAHLFPGDSKEAVALLLCGRHAGATRHVFTVHQVVTVPYEVCKRYSDRITWPTDLVDQLLGTTINLIRSQAEDVPEAAGNEISPDPDDEPFCTCAEMGKADFIATLNPADFPQQRLRAQQAISL